MEHDSLSQKKPLAGIRVVELASLVAGPCCGKALADLGADVVKVEPPEGDEARRRGPFPGDTPHPEKSLLFLYLNANKRGVTLDMESKEGRRAFRALAATADVLVEDRRPGTLERWGLGAAALRAENPQLIVVSITPFGQTGPYAGYRAEALNIDHSSGQAFSIRDLTTQRANPPLKVGGLVSDYDAGMAAAVATLGALALRNATGQGHHVDVSRLEAVMSLERVVIGAWASGDTMVVPHPIRPGGLFEVKDGFADIMSVEDHQWRSLVEMMGSPEWARNPALAKAEGREQHAAEFRPLMEAWAKQQGKLDVLLTGQGKGVPIGAVLTPSELWESPQLAARRFFQAVRHPVAGELRYPTVAYRMSSGEHRIERPAPLLGQHTKEVFDPLTAKAATSRQARSASISQRLPLEGVRVLDFTWAWAGPYGTMLLALLGAEVLKVESRKRLDHTRRTSFTTAQHFSGTDQSPVFNELNLNKRSITLDLSHPKAIELAKRLALVSDVVTANMRPGVMERLGLGYEVFKKLKPDLVVAFSSAMGSTRPQREFVGYAPTFSALAGLAHITGYEGGPPVTMTGSVDLRSATAFALAILAALQAQRRDGLGQAIDVSSAEAVIAHLGEALLDYQCNGREAQRWGNRLPGFAPHNCYRCAGDDAWVTIAVMSDEEWLRFRQAVGDPAWSRDSRFATAAGRWEAREELDRRVEQWTSARTPQEVTLLLQGAGVAATPSLTPKQVTEDPHVKVRQPFAAVEHGVLGRRMALKAPWHMSACPEAPVRAGPILGEANDYAFGELLGLSQGELQRLEEDGAVY